MRYDFEHIVDLGPDNMQTAMVGHEPDSTLVQYFQRDERIESKSANVYLGQYGTLEEDLEIDDLSRMTNNLARRIGIKTHVGFGAYGFFEDIETEYTHILLPINSQDDVPPVALKSIIPPMSDNREPAPFVAFASNANAGREAWRAFNNVMGPASNPDDSWQSIWNTFPTGTATAKTGSAWLAIDLGTSTKVSRYTVYSRASTMLQGSPTSYTFEGSNNGTSWVVLNTVINRPIGNNGIHISHDLSVAAEYRYYRLNITKITSDASYAMTAAIVGQLQLWSPE